MSSKLSIPKSTGKRSIFQVGQLVLAVVASFVLWAVWLVTLPGLELIRTTRPLYFPEAPYWHIGLYFSAFAATGYAIVGAIWVWLERNDQRKKS